MIYLLAALSAPLFAGLSYLVFRGFFNAALGGRPDQKTNRWLWLAAWSNALPWVVLIEATLWMLVGWKP